MADPKEIRKIILQNEYEELSELDSMSDIIKIFPLGSPPYEKYRIVFNIRTIVGPGPVYRDQTVCTLWIPERYPCEGPLIRSDDRPAPWHPDWYMDGRWSYGFWNIGDSLVHYLYRCARTLQYDPVMVSNGPSNRDAFFFWEANKDNPDVIPCDKQVLPVLPEKPDRIPPKKPTIRIVKKTRDDCET